MGGHRDYVIGRTTPRSAAVSVRLGTTQEKRVVQGIILAGGHPWGDCVLDIIGSQLLLPIAARPLLCHMVSWLRGAGTATATVCANSQTTGLYRCFGDGRALGISLHYLEDLMPRGPAGCTKDATICPDANALVVVEGTVLPRLQLAKLLDFHEASGAVLTVVAKSRHQSVGNGKQALEPAGIYVFSKTALARIPENGYQDIKEGLIPQLHRQGERISIYQIDGSLALRVRGAASYLAVSKWMVEQAVLSGKAPEGYVREGESLVHKTARVDSTVELIGPVMIEPGCVLGSSSMIIGPTMVGEGCIVDHGAIVSRSTLWRDCRVGPGAIVDRCLLTDGSEVDSGRLALREGIGVVPRRRKGEGVRQISPVLRRSGRCGRMTDERSDVVEKSFLVGEVQSHSAVNSSPDVGRWNLCGTRKVAISRQGGRK